MIKPRLGDFDRYQVPPEFQWFWDRRSFCLRFNEGTIKPLVLDNGVYRDIVTVFEGSTGGNSTEKLDAGRTGIRPDFSGADGAGGGEWAYHIDDSDLPDWFPGKNGGTPSNEFTCLLLIEPAAISGTSQIVLQKDAATGTPLFCFVRDDVRCNVGSGTSITTSLLSAGREEMVGCVHDGTDQYVIGQARWQDPVTTSITTNTGPLNVGTRTSTIDVFNSRFNGGISGIIFIDMAIDGKFLHQLDIDFFGPFRSVPIPSLFDQQPILPKIAQSVKIGKINIQNAGRAK